jgi:hypothetical protein
MGYAGSCAVKNARSARPSDFSLNLQSGLEVERSAETVWPDRLRPRSNGAVLIDLDLPVSSVRPGNSASAPEMLRIGARDPKDQVADSAWEPVTWPFKCRGDRIRTCDLFVPK